MATVEMATAPSTASVAAPMTSMAAMRAMFAVVGPGKQPGKVVECAAMPMGLAAGVIVL